MVGNKTDDIKSIGAKTLLAGDMGSLMNMAGNTPLKNGFRHTKLWRGFLNRQPDAAKRGGYALYAQYTSRYRILRF